MLEVGCSTSDILTLSLSQDSDLELATNVEDRRGVVANGTDDGCSTVSEGACDEVGGGWGGEVRDGLGGEVGGGWGGEVRDGLGGEVGGGWGGEVGGGWGEVEGAWGGEVGGNC